VVPTAGVDDGTESVLGFDHGSVTLPIYSWVGMKQSPRCTSATVWPAVRAMNDDDDDEG
jgi:hypothetical protein